MQKHHSKSFESVQPTSTPSVHGVHLVEGSTGAVPVREGAAGPPGTKLDKYQDIVGERVRIASCGCQSVWCERCRRRMAGDRKRYLRECVFGWSDRRMLTLTIDQKRFPGGPGEAYDLVKAKRLVAELMRTFKVRRWVAVLEVQENGWPHWHVLIDRWLNAVPVRHWWTERCGVLPAWRPTQVKITWCEGKGDKAVNYLCGYLAKGGRAPEWILERTNVRGIAVSRTLMAWSVWLKGEPSTADSDGIPRRGGKHRVIGLRLDACGSSSVVLIEDVSASGEVIGRRRFMGRVPYSLAVVCEVLWRDGIGVGEVMDREVLEWKNTSLTDEPRWVPRVEREVGVRALQLYPCDGRRLFELLGECDRVRLELAA